LEGGVFPQAKQNPPSSGGGAAGGEEACPGRGGLMPEEEVFFRGGEPFGSPLILPFPMEVLRKGRDGFSPPDGSAGKK